MRIVKSKEISNRKMPEYKTEYFFSELKHDKTYYNGKET